MPKVNKVQRKSVKAINVSSKTKGKTVRPPKRNHPKAPDDPSRAEWMKLGAESSALGFWNRPEEDIYSPDDGKPI